MTKLALSCCISSLRMKTHVYIRVAD